MELKIDREILLKAMSRVQGILEKKSHMPILSTVLLTVGKDLELSATDLEINFKDTYPAEVIQPGQITISGAKLLAIAKETNATHIHIQEKDNNWVYISDGNAHFNLAGLAADEFPELTEPEGVVMIDVDGLSEMIAKTIYAASVEDAGFKLSGVFMEVTKEKSLKMVATDGHRLSLIDKQIPGIDKLEIGDGIMIPKKGLIELNKLADETISMGVKDTNLVVRKETTLIVVRLLDAKFPDYKNVIPTEGNIAVITVNRQHLLGAVRRMMILYSDQYQQGMKLTIDGDSLEFASVNPDLGNAKEKVEVEYTGEPMEMGFNPKYFIDALSSMDSNAVYLNIKDQSSPCLITGDKDEGFLGLIMPMRV
jgi:DNA polymerase-3 subunit beta